MITFYRIACVQAGKMGPAMAFAHEIAGYVKDVFHAPIEVALPIGGNPNRIAWSVRYTDMVAMDAMQEKMLRDAKYQQIVAKGADFLISGATRDSLWRGV